MVGVVTPYSLMLLGVAVAILPLYPGSDKAYIRKFFREKLPFAMAIYVISLVGCGVAYYVFTSRLPMEYWLVSLLPAVVYWFSVTEPAKPEKETKPKGQGGRADA